MKLQHFLKYCKNGVGYQLLKSKGVDNLLSRDNLNDLTHIAGSGITKSWVPSDKVVARSYITYTLDEMLRHNTWNHTILIFILDYIQIQNFDVVDKHFIRENAEVPKKLEPLRIDVP